MKLIPTFIDGNFYGYETMKEINRLKKRSLRACNFKTE